MFSTLLPIILIALSGSASENLITEKSFQADQIQRLEVKLGAGNLQIIGTNKETASVSIGMDMKHKNDCETNVYLNEKKRELKVKVKNRKMMSHCRADLIIEVAGNTEVDAFTGSGDVSIDHIESRVDIETGSGDIEITNSEISDLHAKTGSGEVKATQLLDKVSILTGSGDIDLVFSNSAKSGEVNVKTGSGDLSIRLPKKSVTDVNYKSFAGDFRNDFKTDPEGNFEIDFISGSGDLAIQALK